MSDLFEDAITVRKPPKKSRSSTMEPATAGKGASFADRLPPSAHLAFLCGFMMLKAQHARLPSWDPYRLLGASAPPPPAVRIQYSAANGNTIEYYDAPIAATGNKRKA